jgi:hypothetical protein
MTDPHIPVPGINTEADEVPNESPATEVNEALLTGDLATEFLQEFLMVTFGSTFDIARQKFTADKEGK